MAIEWVPSWIINRLLKGFAARFSELVVDTPLLGTIHTGGYTHRNMKKSVFIISSNGE